MPILSRIAHQGPTACLCRSLLVAGFIYLSSNVLVRADTPATHDFQIGPQALASALVEFSKQADVQVLGATNTIQTLRTPGVIGHFTEEQALEQLLRGTALSFLVVLDWRAYRHPDCRAAASITGLLRAMPTPMSLRSALPKRSRPLARAPTLRASLHPKRQMPERRI